MKTIITHFYNEEYLLPWWLEHHKKYFDNGILIDYNSTDTSRRIINKICPNWKIVQSFNRDFGAESCDKEVEYYERQIQGWRIALTVTEFLVGDINKLTQPSLEKKQYIIPEIRFAAWDLTGKLDKDRLLWQQIKTGVPYTDIKNAHSPRSMHNFNDMIYPIRGRHYQQGTYTTEDAIIFHYAHSVIGLDMLKRKLQIQTRMAKGDVLGGELGWQHTFRGKGLDVASAKILHDENFNVGVVDCTDIINNIVEKSENSNHTFL